MNQQDDQHDQPEEDYGQDYYDDGQQGYDDQGQYAGDEYAGAEYNEHQLPTPEKRTFFQRYANIIIFGGIGIFVLVMGYVNFGHMLFPPPQEKTGPSVNADQLLNPVTPPQGATDENAPVVPGAEFPVANMSDVPVPQPVPDMNAMGITPEAPETVAPAPGEMAKSPVAPPDEPQDPWADIAAAPQGQPAEPPPEPAPEAPPKPVVSSAPPAEMPLATPVPSQEAEKLAEAQKKLEEAEAARAQQEATIAELQNKLAEAQARAAEEQSAPVSTEEPAPKPKPKPKKPTRATTAKPVSDWELRAASDGMAWVARRGDNQLFRVGVGDEVPGIGRVTSIREQNGTWYVIGTQGQIRQ